MVFYTRAPQQNWARVNGINPAEGGKARKEYYDET